MDVSSFYLHAPLVAHSHSPRAALRRTALTMLVLATLAPGFATAQALSLEQAVAAATQRAPILLARDASRQARSEELARAGALPDPTLIVGVQNFPIGGPDAYTVNRDRMTMQRIGISQALPSRAKRNARRELARALLDQAGADAVATTLDVERATAKAWVLLWASQHERDQLQDLHEQAALAVRATRARLAGGGGNAGDALATRASELELQNRIDDADARIAQARAGLQRWLGDAAVDAADAPPDFSNAPMSEARMLAQLDQQGPLLAWDAREASADAALALARAEKRPDWSVGGGFAKRGGGGSNVVWLEVGIGLPLFPGNRQDRGISARSADLAAVHASREDARRMQTETVRKAFARWQGLGAQVARTRDSLLPLAHDRSRVALAAYSGGAALQPWLEARRDEFDARIDYAKLLGEWGQAWAELAYLLPSSDSASTSQHTHLPEIAQ
jgi:cobalt-zinc-cadmium efflux system outer membrane protein